MAISQLLSLQYNSDICLIFLDLILENYEDVVNLIKKIQPKLSEKAILFLLVIFSEESAKLQKY